MLGRSQDAIKKVMAPLKAPRFRSWLVFFGLFLGLSFGLITMAFASAPKARITVVTHPIPLMVESETKGRFIDFTRRLLDEEKVDVEIIVLPTNRALEFFRQKKALIFFPGNEVYDLGDHLQTLPFYSKKDFAFHRSENKVSGLQDLKDKILGLTLGYPYDEKLLHRPGVAFEVAPSDEANFFKLASHRIDAFIVEEVTGLKALKSTKLKGITYNKKAPLSTLPVYFALQNSPTGRKWQQILNHKIKAQKTLLDTLKDPEPL